MVGEASRPQAGEEDELERRRRCQVQLRRSVERIALAKRHVKKDGTPNYEKLGNVTVDSRSAFESLKRGGFPHPESLVALARYAGESPIWLFTDACWLQHEDVLQYLQEARQREPLSPELRARILDEVERSQQMTRITRERLEAVLLIVGQALAVLDQSPATPGPTPGAEHPEPPRNAPPTA
jgi:hypothetical protein